MTPPRVDLFELPPDLVDGGRQIAGSIPVVVRVQSELDELNHAFRQIVQRIEVRRGDFAGPQSGTVP